MKYKNPLRIFPKSNQHRLIVEFLNKLELIRKSLCHLSIVVYQITIELYGSKQSLNTSHGFCVRILEVAWLNGFFRVSCGFCQMIPRTRIVLIVSSIRCLMSYLGRFKWQESGTAREAPSVSPSISSLRDLPTT